jgi:2-oxoglutarate ferredoxin oxidoreductase subunit gamma
MNDAVNVKVAGFGGQGVMMFGQMLAYSATEEEMYTLWVPSYGPETRGGTANCSVIVSRKPINSPVFQKADRLVAFNLPSLAKFRDKVAKGGLVLYNSSLIKEDVKIADARVIAVPANDIALALGNIQVANMVMLGAFLAATDMFQDATVDHILQKFLGERKAHLMPINRSAIAAGRDLVKGGAELHA